jgi:HNH endonuclease
MNAAALASLRVRFWRHVNKDGECWTWTAAKWGSGGYGMVTLGGRIRVLAHRAAWMLTHGPIPMEMCVLHRCDTPTCVRPEHLFLGTRADNMRDMAEKGRAARPFGNTYGAKLRTPEEYAAIRARHLVDGLTQVAVAREFGIHPTMVNKIVLGKRGV